MEGDNPTFSATTIVKFCILLVTGLVLLSGVATNNTVSTIISAQISFTRNPIDGDTITIDNHVFEFDSNSIATGYTPVAIGTAKTATRDNLATALHTYYTMEVSQ